MLVRLYALEAARFLMLRVGVSSDALTLVVTSRLLEFFIE